MTAKKVSKHSLKSLSVDDVEVDGVTLLFNGDTGFRLNGHQLSQLETLVARCRNHCGHIVPDQAPADVSTPDGF